MKKLVNFLAIALIALASVFTFTACDPQSGDTTQGFTYNVDLDACADGDLLVTFPNGRLNLEGDALVEFNYSNDSIPNLMSNGFVCAEDTALTAEQIEAVAAANDWFDQNFTVSSTSAGGHYCVKAAGYVKEPISGLVIRLSKTFPENCSCDSLQ